MVEEIRCRSVLNRVDSPRLPFRWTINPYRGCSHACVYCYARLTHTYLGLDAGEDFQTRLFAKVNAPELLARELTRTSWRRELVAVGTATDPYQPVEVDYGLTRRILELLARHLTPASVTTKGTLVLRDVDVLQEMTCGAGVTVNVSVTTLNERVWRVMEPATPHPRARLEVVQALAEAGVRAGVFMAPILPGLTDAEGDVRRLHEAARAHRAAFVVGMPLRLDDGTRDWYMQMLKHAFPEHVGLHRALFQSGCYPTRRYVDRLLERVERTKQETGFSEPDEQAREAVDAVSSDRETDADPTELPRLALVGHRLRRKADAARARVAERVAPIPPQLVQMVLPG